MYQSTFQEENKVQDLGERNLSAKRRTQSESRHGSNLLRKNYFEDKFREIILKKIKQSKNLKILRIKFKRKGTE